MLEVNNQHKKTEIGYIPNDWDIKILGECVIGKPDYGINAPAVEYSDSLPTYLRITDISDDGHYRKVNPVSVNHSQSSIYFLEKGDIVFARTGASVGKTYLYDKSDGRLVFAGFLIRVKPNPNILEPLYLKFYTQTKIYWSWVLANSMRSGQPGINGKEYSFLPIPLPPTKAEQTAIATALSDADAFIQSLEKLIVKKRLIKQGAMQELLKPKEGWVVKKLGEVCIYINDGTHHTPRYVNEGIPFYSVENVTSDNFKHVKFITKEEHEELIKRCKPERGDILLTRIGSIGKTKLIDWDVNASIYVSLALLKIGDNIDSRYLYMYTKSRQFSLDIENRSLMNAVPQKINMGDIHSVPISLPPDINEQVRIAKILSDMDTEISTLESKLEKYKQIKQGMMQNLLTGKIRLV